MFKSEKETLYAKLTNCIAIAKVELEYGDIKSAEKNIKIGMELLDKIKNMK